MATQRQLQQIKKWNAAHMKQKYDRIGLLCPKGAKALVKAAADASGESLNQFIIRATMARMGLEKWPDAVKGEQDDD